MLWNKIWDFIVESGISFFLPIVCSYYALSSHLFFNVACEEATGLERWGNTLLIPSQYLLAGQSASRNEQGEWIFQPRFSYENNFWIKTTASTITAVPSFVAGSLIKGLSLLGEESRRHHREITLFLHTKPARHEPSRYLTYGIDLQQGEPEWIFPQGYIRKPGDEHHLDPEKKALRDITHLLDEAGIPWWVDCGTCLGAYRYGGVIPWDEDVDIAVLLPDFHDVYRTLLQLDPRKYLVQNWSSRDYPHSYLKIFIRESSTLVDVYHFAINTKTRTLSYVFSLENALFFPDWWKAREQRFKVPVSFDAVFPFKKGLFDGLEVNVPRETQAYLQRCYGENLAPAKIYNNQTGGYEKDLSHPYWQRSYVH
ncbi:MAG: LicD family protein [Verrucomicrobiota bacterium]|nr:LicD family protein [Verrucomicrobiota bacterium]